MANDTQASPITLPSSLPSVAAQFLMDVGLRKLAALTDPRNSPDEQLKANREFTQYRNHLISRGGWVEDKVQNPLDVMKGAPEPDPNEQAHEAAQHSHGVGASFDTVTQKTAVPTQERPDDPNPPQDEPTSDVG